MLFFINGSGLSIDRSTWVSAAKLKIIEGLYLFNNLVNKILLPISALKKT